MGCQEMQLSRPKMQPSHFRPVGLGPMVAQQFGISAHVVARTANGASSDVVLGELSPSYLT